MKGLQWVAALAMAAQMGLFAGCRTPHDTADRTPDLPLPDTFEGGFHSHETREGDGWLNRLGGPALKALAVEVLKENRDLHQAAARILDAQGAAQIAGADRWPTLGAGVNASRRRVNQIGGGIQVGSVTVSSFDGLLSSSWEWDIWGRLADTREAARRDEAATLRDYEAAQLSLLGQFAKLWFSVVEIREQLALAERRLEVFESNEQLVERQFERGLAGALDLRLIRSQTLSTRAAKVDQQAALDAGLRRLEILLGRYPSGALAVGESLPDLGPALSPGLPSNLLQRRPDLLAAEERLRGASLRTSAADKLRFPQFSLTGGGGTSSTELSDLLNSDFRVWSLAGNLSQPLFQGGRISGNRVRARAQWELALAAYEKTALAAFREVETALAGEQYLRERLVHLQAVVEESQAAEALAWDRYERGLVEVVTVLETQRRAFEAKSGKLVVRNALLQNRIDLDLALGGFPLESYEGGTGDTMARQTTRTGNKEEK